MKKSKILSIIKNSTNNKFVVKMNGKKEIVRLFIYGDDTICKFRPRSRKRGNIWMVDYNKITDFVPYQKTIDPVKKWRHNIELAIKYLSSSGLWLCFLKEIQTLNSLSDDELKKIHDMIDCSKFKEYEQYRNKYRIPQFLMSEGLLSINSPFTTIRFDRCERELRIADIKRMIQDKRKYYTKYNVFGSSYDYSIELAFDEDYPRAWYSVEYSGCANGHYYYLFDERHAFHVEDD